jgi:hypothetical protein
VAVFTQRSTRPGTVFKQSGFFEFRERGAHPQLTLRGVTSLTKKKNHIPSEGRPLEIADLEQIVGGATATHQQYDAAKQNLLGEINNADITNAVAADAASIASNPTNVAIIAAAITNIDSHAATDHVSELAALAALDAATYGNAKINGTDAVAAALTQALTSGSGEADMAHVAALGAKPSTIISELDQAVNVLAIGSSNGNTALGLQENVAIDVVEARLATATTSEVAKDLTASIAATAAYAVDLAEFRPSAADEAVIMTDTTMATAASALQTELNTVHQAEVTEGQSVLDVFNELGGQLGTIQADALALQGLTGAAAQAQIAAAEHAAGIPNEVTLVALDLLSGGNATVQQTLSNEYTSGTLVSNLANEVVSGAIGGGLAVETLNLIVADLAQDSLSPSAIPALAQGFAEATADVALANTAGTLAAQDIAAAANAGSIALSIGDIAKGVVAEGLKLLIDTNYASEVSLANELTSVEALLGTHAATVEQLGENLITNQGLAETYIQEIESGSIAGVTSVDAALTVLAVFSHGNQQVLGEIQSRLSNGDTVTDLTNLVGSGALTAAQALACLSGVVDALAANSPTNSVTLTASDQQVMTLDRNSALDWAEGQLLKSVLAADGNGVAPPIYDPQWIRLNQLGTLMENTQGEQIITGLGIDAAWTSSLASINAAAAIAAGTVETSYGPEPTSAATAQANSIMQTADEREVTDATVAAAVMQDNLQATWNADISGGQTLAIDGVELSGQSLGSLFAQGGSFVEDNFYPVLPAATTAFQDPTLANFVALGEVIGEGQVPGWVGDLSLATTGLASLVESSAVSGVIGTSASGDLKQAFTVLHDAAQGQINLVALVAQMDGQAAIALGNQLATVSEKTYSLGYDLLHGNDSNLGADATALFSSLGTAAEMIGEDLSIAAIGMPLTGVQAYAEQAIGVLGQLASDIGASSLLSSAENFMKTEGIDILQSVSAAYGSAGAEFASIADDAKDVVDDAVSGIESGWDSVKDWFEHPSF